MCADNMISRPKQSEIMAKIKANKQQPAPNTAATASLVPQRLVIALHCPRAGPLFAHQPFSSAAVVIISSTFCIEQAETIKSFGTSINCTCSGVTEAFVTTILQCIVWPIWWRHLFRRVLHVIAGHQEAKDIGTILNVCSSTYCASALTRLAPVSVKCSMRVRAGARVCALCCACYCHIACMHMCM